MRPRRCRSAARRRSRSQTDGVAPNSGDAVKTFVDANIQITPNGVNRVGRDAHVHGARERQRGHGDGFVNAPDGTQISFTIDTGPGAFTSANPCTTAGGTGAARSTCSSAVTGVDDRQRALDALGRRCLADAAHERRRVRTPARRRSTWVNAKIAIAPNATNEVGAAAHVHGDPVEGHR